jgi:hypothetical protein
VHEHAWDSQGGGFLHDQRHARDFPRESIKQGGDSGFDPQPEALVKASGLSHGATASDGFFEAN